MSRPTSCLKQSITSSNQDAEAFIEMGLEEPLRRETAQTLERVLIVRKCHSAPRLFQGALAAAQLAAHLSPGPSLELLPVPAGVSAAAGALPARGRAAPCSPLTFTRLLLDSSPARRISVLHCCTPNVVFLCLFDSFIMVGVLLSFFVCVFLFCVLNRSYSAASR